MLHLSGTYIDYIPQLDDCHVRWVPVLWFESGVAVASSTPALW